MDSSNISTLIAWELGAGLGHVYPVAALATELQLRGHRVALALRDTAATARIPLPAGVSLIKAPVDDVSTPVVQYPTCLAHVLLNTGFSDIEELASRVARWCEIFKESQASIVVCDHAPTAQLAARCVSLPVVRMGTGFCCPPEDDLQTRDLRPWRHVPEAEVRRAEDQVVRNVNEILARHNAQPLGSFIEVFTAVDETFLLTFRAMDHFPRRKNATYWGPAPLPKAQPPVWPSGAAPKVLAYLKPFPELPQVLDHLRNRRFATLLLGSEIAERLQRRFACDSFSFASELIDIELAVQECDLAITNATHAVTAAALLAGKRVVMVPILLEQAILAKRIIESGVGIWAYPDKPADINSAIDCVVRNPVYRRRAEELATRYAGFSAADSISRVANRIDQFVNRS